MHTLKLIISLIFVPLGITLFYLAEIDDSPGGQLIAAIMAIIGIISTYKQITQNSK